MPLELDQIVAAVRQDGHTTTYTLYGLSTNGLVYRWNSHRDGWEGLPMREIEYESRRERRDKDGRQ